MPYTRPQTLGDNSNNLLNQPIPLRLVPFITHWSTEQLLKYLVEIFPMSNNVLLPAYEYCDDKNPGTIEINDYIDLLSKTPVENLLQAIPYNHFIWSDDLIQAYSRHLDLYYERDDSPLVGCTLSWNPALGENKELIENCSDFYKILPKPLQYKNRTLKQGEKNKVRDQLWLKEFMRLKNKNPKISVSAVAEKIEGTALAQKRGWDCIRKTITRLLKLGK